MRFIIIDLLIAVFLVYTFLYIADGTNTFFLLLILPLLRTSTAEKKVGLLFTVSEKTLFPPSATFQDML